MAQMLNVVKARFLSNQMLAKGASTYDGQCEEDAKGESKCL